MKEKHIDNDSAVGIGDNFYALIAPVLRACVLTDETSNLSQVSAPEAVIPLRDWVELQLHESGHIVSLTAEVVVSKLKDTAKELTEWVEEVPEVNLTGYKQLKFIHHLLCEPPTVIGILARRFEVSIEIIKDWLSDNPQFQDSKRVAHRIVAHLRDLCGEPEDPVRIYPEGNLTSFDDLIFLGGLRQVFDKLYRGMVPKAAQGKYIPVILRQLGERFFGNGSGRVVVVAPTNGGKNGMILTAALAAVAWDEGPVLVLQPYRAQISESQRSWYEAVAGRLVRRRRTEVTTGVRVAGSSALISDFDFDIVRGRIDIAAIIPEKLAVLSRNRELRTFCNLLIADEIGLLLSEDRGAKLEIILTLAKETGMPIMATGAALSSMAAERIARWLADIPGKENEQLTNVLLFDPELRRDPPIEYWVWRRDGKRRFWREGMNVLDTMEADVDPLPDNEEDAISDLIVRELKELPERQILVFVENRQRVVDLADNIARQLRGPEFAIGKSLSLIAGDDDEAPLSDLWLGGTLPSPVDMKSILSCRVGVHTRDVPSNDLERIEDAFRSGRLRVLCATTTVEAGINLPVDTVVQIGLLDHDGRKLSQRALEQRLGRSGRTIAGKNQSGKGIIYVHDSKQLIERVIKERILKQDESFESKLDESYRALLLLAYVGSSSDKTDENLEKVLGQSYWAFGRRPDEIKSATHSAIANLRQAKLIESDLAPEGEAALRVWSATPLGQALSAALLLPGDAKAIEEIVRVAEESKPDESWLPEVLFAACKVPSQLNVSRRPREDDVVSKPPMTQKAVVKSWVKREHESAIYSFGFPRKKSRMFGRQALGETLQRIFDGRPRPLEDRAIIRAYICWLWMRGESLDVKACIKGLNEHVVQQDLAYYTSHVLRAASWLAQYDGKFVVGLRLRELAREVEFGVPRAAVTFFETCRDHISRQAVSLVDDYDYRKLLASLDARVADDLSRRLEVRRERRHSHDLSSALACGAVDNEDERIRFDRMENAKDVLDRLSKVWDSDAGELQLVDGRTLRAGPCLIHVISSESEASSPSIDIAICVSALSEAMQLSRKARAVSLVGSEEFVVLVSRLATLAGNEQALLLSVLRDMRRVCDRDLIGALDAEISGNLWEDESTLRRGVSVTVASARGISIWLNKVSILFDLEKEKRSLGAYVAGPLSGGWQKGADLLSGAIEDLLAYVDKNIESRRRALVGGIVQADGSELGENLKIWEGRRGRVIGLRADLESARSTVEVGGIAKYLNELGSDCMGLIWRPLDVGN